MTKYYICPDAAPSPSSARYSHAVEHRGVLYITGQLPVDPDNPNTLLPSSIEEQTEIVFTNLLRIAAHAGYKIENTLFARIYLTNFDRDYSGFNGIFHRYFNNDTKLPGRTTVGVAQLGRNALVEVDLTLGQSSE